MSLTATTLAKAITTLDDEFSLTSTTGLVAGYVLKVDSEYMRVISVVGTWIKVARGQHGTYAVAHGILALAVFGPGGEFKVWPEPRTYTYGETGALTRAPGIHLLQGTVTARTLAPPDADDEGLTMLLVAVTATAFTVTLTSGTFNQDGVSNRLVFDAIGDSCELIAIGGYWCTKAQTSIALPSISPSVSASVSASKSPSSSFSSSPSVSSSVSASVSPSVSASKSPSVSASSSESPSPS